MRQSEFNTLSRLGVHGYDPRAVMLSDAMRDNPKLAMDALVTARLARDAQPGLISTPNTGVPAYFANLIDPEVIRVITQPMKSAEIFGETQKGDWKTLFATFRMIEVTGEVASYGDYDTNGRSGHNVNYPTRQSYHFQTMTEWGEREVEIESLAGIYYVSEQNTSSALILNKFHNLMNFYGIAGLNLYGALNDPALPSAIAPALKAAGGVLWGPAVANEVYEDVRLLFVQLQTQMGGNAKVSDEMTLALSPTKEVDLLKTNIYNVQALELIKRNFPRLRVETAPEYSTAAGELMQLKLDKVDGKETTYTAFTEKMRAHAVIQKASSWEQKKSAGGWGTIIRYPVAVASMLGM
jgi:hypothetical protein